MAKPPVPAVFEQVSVLPVSAERAFAWHERPGAFERLVPPWDAVEIERVEGPPPPKPGSRVHLRIGLAPGIKVRWVAEHRDYEFGRLFRDVMINAGAAGPFAAWDHRHMFRDLAGVGGGDGTSELRDRIEFRLPMGALGRALGLSFTRAKLNAMFAYRHAITRHDLAMHARFSSRPRRRVLVSGASGILGTPLCALLSTGGHEVFRLVRPPRVSSENQIAWDPGAGTIDHAALARTRVDAVVHLAGENVNPGWTGRWNESFKRRFLDSRVRGTRLLVDAVTKLSEPPEVFVCASGTGYYGDRGEQTLVESDGPGDGFLSDVTLAWEREAMVASSRVGGAGVRTCVLRIGPTLTPRGGMLASLLASYRMGLGGRLGSGEQFVPWVGLDDCLAAMHECIMNPGLRGPINVTSPNPVRQMDFARTLARVLGKPLLGSPLTRGMPRLLGQMGQECLLASTRVHPAALVSAGFVFWQPELETALCHILGRVGPGGRVTTPADA